jgi:signal transduction histidine kinase
MPERVGPQLGRVVILPFATIGVIAAVLVWAVEHAPSLLLMISIVSGSIAIGVVVARRVRANIETLAAHYESMLQLAEDQSRQAEAANRIKDEFLATLSHELRTPLNSVLGWARLLASGKLDSSQTARAIQAIERAGWSQSRLIEDLLDISRIAAGKLQINPRPTSVQPLVEAAVDSLRPAAEAKHITVTMSLDPNAGAVTVDPDRLQQVVWNLVSNAIKFTRTDGHVDVAAGIYGGELVITVDDDGIGFPTEVAMHLFERFRQGDSSTTRAYSGLGLGLGIVRHLVELHGGTVTASSAGENAGSHFEVRMPVTPANAPAIAAPFPQPQLPSLRGVSVLVVDDDPQALEFARSVLEQTGAIVVTAGSAREAEARFSREPTDVVLSDLMMPGEDGWQLIRAIRKLDEARGRRTPAAALTALARTEDRRRALKAGYQMHIAKPIDPGELISTVEHLAHAYSH